jgi:hypothetical protein
MIFFRKFVLLFTITIALTFVILPRHYAVTFPREPGPELDRYARTDSIRYMEENHPQIILLGDSTLALGVDEDLLAQSTGKSVYNMAKLGSASSMWYLILKNNIVESSYKPEYVVVVFRNSILTAPGFRAQGNYFTRLDEYARKNEPLFIQNSYVKLMSPIEVVAEKYFPLYVFRSRIRETVDKKIRYLGAGLLGCDQVCTDDALRHTFAAEDFEPEALVDALNAADKLIYTNYQLDFEARVNDSYLPEMIRLAHENGIEIVFVRIKVQQFNYMQDPTSYLRSLFSYLDDNDVPYLDFGDDPRLTSDFFQDTSHLNKKGRVLFTQILADGLEEIFSEK